MKKIKLHFINKETFYNYIKENGTSDILEIDNKYLTIIIQKGEN